MKCARKGYLHMKKTFGAGAVYMEEAYPNLLFAKDGEVFELME